jgi:hypothetical protein
MVDGVAAANPPATAPPKNLRREIFLAIVEPRIFIDCFEM